MMVSSNVGNSHACVRLSLDGGDVVGIFLMKNDSCSQLYLTNLALFESGKISSDLLLLPFWGLASLVGRDLPISPKLLPKTAGMILSTMHRGVLPVVQNYWV